MGPSRSVRLLDADPDLAAGLTPDEGRSAAEQSVVRVGSVEPGKWRPAEQKADTGTFGLFVLEGLMLRNVTVGERTCAEVIGPGDIVRPWVRAESGAASIESTVEWTAVGDTAMAVLDGGFVGRMTAWPPVIGALGDRVMLRTHWLAFHLAVCHMRRVDERLLIVLWHFADRWGRVTGSGTVVPLPFTHALLARVVGAQRPTVSTALAELQRNGWLSRGDGQGWVLHGEPPADLTEVRNSPTGNGRIDLRELED